jgi:hypothetical protein
MNAKTAGTATTTGTPTTVGMPSTTETPGAEKMSTTAGIKQQQEYHQQKGCLKRRDASHSRNANNNDGNPRSRKEVNNARIPATTDTPTTA